MGTEPPPGRTDLLMKMITIGKPYITTENDTAYLRAPVHISKDTVRVYLEKTAPLKNTAWLTAFDYPPAVWQEEDCNLWFSAPSQYAEYLSTERSNAFVIAMLWYAMITGSDIRSEAPMSRKLYDGLTQKLIPTLMQDQIRLDGSVTGEPIECAGGVLTGMSCGVDSLYTLHCYDRPDAPGGKRLTHLAYYDCNYLLPFLDPPYDINAIYREKDKLRIVHFLSGFFIHLGMNLLKICFFKCQFELFLLIFTQAAAIIVLEKTDHIPAGSETQEKGSELIDLIDHRCSVVNPVFVRIHLRKPGKGGRKRTCLLPGEDFCSAGRPYLPEGIPDHCRRAVGKLDDAGPLLSDSYVSLIFPEFSCPFRCHD